MSRVTITTIDHHVVLVVFEGDQLLGRRNDDELNALLLLQVVRSDDMHTILSSGQNTKLVGNLDARDLGVIREDPIDTILQEADQLGMRNGDDHNVRALQLLLQAVDHALEVFPRILHPVSDVVGETVIRQSVEVTRHSQLLIAERTSSSGFLSIEAVIQEGTDLVVLQLSQSTAHHVDVIRNHVDALQSQSISSFLNGNGGVQTRTRLGHLLLDLLVLTNHGQTALVPTVAQLAVHLDLVDLIGSRNDSNATTLEVDIADQSIGLTTIGTIADNLRREGMSSRIRSDVDGNPNIFSSEVNLSDLQRLVQHLSTIGDNTNSREILSSQDINILQRQSDLLGSIHGNTLRLLRQFRHRFIVIEDIGHLVLSTISRLDITTLEGEVDHRRVGDLSHQDILEDAGNPLLLQEEGVVRNDGMVTLGDRLDRHAGQRVVQQETETVRVVVVEHAVGHTAVSEHRIALERLHDAILKLTTVGGAADDLIQIRGQIHTTASVGFKNTFHIGLEAGILVTDIVITDDAGFLTESIQKIGHFCKTSSLDRVF